MQVMDWAGYEVKPLWAQYLKKYPGQKPKFTFMTNEADAFAKLRAGVRPDVLRPYVGYVRDFAESGFVQPWDAEADHEPQVPQSGGWSRRASTTESSTGFRPTGASTRSCYRTDKVHPKEKSWSLLFDKRYGGKIAWYDDLSSLVWAGYYLGFKQPYNQSDDELKRSSEVADLEEEARAHVLGPPRPTLNNAFASGDLWIAYAWPNDWVTDEGAKA